jgi:hypothetical protein
MVSRATARSTMTVSCPEYSVPVMFLWIPDAPRGVKRNPISGGKEFIPRFSGARSSKFLKELFTFP